MIFDLTDSLCTEILFAMENQRQDFALDAKSCKVIECASENVDEENIYSLPLWDSSDGYNLLESFVTKFKGVKACDELRRILAEGRGVFKNFKNTLRKYPEIDRRFHSFKDRKMKAVVYEWYNALRESWGLETLALNQDFYEYDDLVLEDFLFRPYDRSLDSGCVKSAAQSFFEELKKQFSGELGLSISAFMKAQFKLYNGLEKTSVNGFICRTLSDEFAGCLLYSSSLSNTKKTSFLTCLFVNRNYRGLGIAKELLSRCISNLAKDGVRFFIISNSYVPKMLRSDLSQMGFTENDFAYVAELN